MYPGSIQIACKGIIVFFKLDIHFFGRYEYWTFFCKLSCMSAIFPNRIPQARNATRIAFLACCISISCLTYAAEPTRDPLFHIERNKNANIVQYDAQLDIDGRLYAKEPVVAYWIRLANKGEIKELTWIQKKFAYGLKSKLDKKHNTARIEMAVDIGRTLVVKRFGEDYRAVGDINGVESFLDRIFIHARGRGISTRVEYIDLFGSSVAGQEEQHERFVP